MSFSPNRSHKGEDTYGWVRRDSFSMARRYFIFLIPSNVGRSVPIYVSTSLLRRDCISGRLESWKNTFAIKAAVVSRPAIRRFRSSERISTRSVVSVASWLRNVTRSGSVVIFSAATWRLDRAFSINLSTKSEWYVMNI